jgi:hypothetical protein
MQAAVMLNNIAVIQARRSNYAQESPYRAQIAPS